MRALVAGATGYIGARLVPRLLDAGLRVRCLARDPDRLADPPWAADVQVVRGDMQRAGTLPAAMRQVDVAYYLVHSLGTRDFERLDWQAATNFAAAARDAGVGRIVYLGGPAPRGRQPSAHLRSREEVARILLDSGVPTVVLRAAVIVGSGSASFEMLRYLTERLPTMVTPRWVRNRVQPIAIGDVLHYLAGCARLPATVHGDFDICGPDVLTFADMMRRYARIAGLQPRAIIPVRPLTPKLSAYWVGLVTPVPSRLARPLVASLVNEAVCRDHRIATVVEDPAGGLTGFDEAVRRALARPAAGQLERTWSPPGAPSDALPSDPAWTGGATQADLRTVELPGSAASLWPAVARTVGGPLRPGAAVGRWQVAQLEPQRLLRMRGRGRLLNHTWLELRLADQDGGCRYQQRLVSRPLGMWGLLAWRIAAPARRVLLNSMLRDITRAATQRPTGG